MIILCLEKGGLVPVLYDEGCLATSVALYPLDALVPALQLGVSRYFQMSGDNSPSTSEISTMKIAPLQDLLSEFGKLKHY